MASIGRRKRKCTKSVNRFRVHESRKNMLTHCAKYVIMLCEDSCADGHSQNPCGHISNSRFHIFLFIVGAESSHPCCTCCYCGFLHHELCNRSLVTTTNLLLQEVSSPALLDYHSNIPTMGTSRCTISLIGIFLFLSSLKQLEHLKLACLADFLLPEVLKHHPFTPLPSRTFQERLGNADCKGTAESLPRALTQTQLWKKDFPKLSGTIHSCLYKKTNLRRIFHHTASASSSSCSR
jgi:hypothetical protein